MYMHSRTPVGLLRPGIINDHSDTGEITRMSKKRVQTGSFSDYAPLLMRQRVPVEILQRNIVYLPLCFAITSGLKRIPLHQK